MSAVGSPVFAVGQYVCTYNSVAVGLFEGDDKCPTLVPTNKAFSVDNTDAFGKKTIERFNMGTDWQFKGTFIEWAAKVKTIMFPFSASPGTPGLEGIIGKAYTDLAQVLVMTALAGTPAAVSGPLTVTANLAILAPNNNPALIFGPALRKAPLTLDLLPYTSSGVVNFTVT